ncbi:tRNA-uridine aminocarboxypropyltransferase [Thaumasiovibrio sp. DFM-14]|uniref:tRNA-uridine aminocarboxypropyltransferase n=1 Tax=Thaumasiovibrio sp. DFM-14 TaxID=3384792 RepID=UPI0039A17630
MPLPCPRCGFTYHCLCEVIPNLQAQSHFVLLQHSRESNKATNTGRLLQQTLPHCRVEMWSRTTPPSSLLRQLQDPAYTPWLVFPADEQHPASHYSAMPNTIPLFVIIDATWQEARKIVRKSPWLQSLPRLQIHLDTPSRYQLRRNQQSGYLCTCEIGAAILAMQGNYDDSKRILAYFEQFQQVYLAEREHQPLAAFKRPKA